MQSSILVIGMGKTGKSVVEFFLKNGDEKILIYDDKQKNLPDNYPKDRVLNVELDYINWESIKEVFLSPGVPISHPLPHPVVKAAIQNGCRITNDIEFFLEYSNYSKRIGVTGTNGKSTATTMIGHLLGFEVLGNIGNPVLESTQDKNGCVIEFSSYQLEVCEFPKLSIAVLLDVTVSHMDRYQSVQEYADVKSRLCSFSDVVPIIALNSEFNKRFFSSFTNARKIAISATEILEHGFSMIGRDIYRDASLITTVSDRIQHFNENILAAFVCCMLDDMSITDFHSGLENYTALTHRIEKCGTCKNITFVNDSKSTNLLSLSRAVDLYKNKKIYLMAGGKSGNVNVKEGDSTKLDCVKRAYFFGESADTFRSVYSNVASTVHAKMKDAFSAAVEDALNDPEEIVILLSPGCSSFDEFKNFEERGNVFKSLAFEFCSSGICM